MSQRNDDESAAIARAHGTDVARVLRGAGRADLIRALIGSVCAPGDEVIFGGRIPESDRDACLAHAATPVVVPMAADGSHDVDAVLGALTPRTRIVSLSSPDSASGRALTRDQLARLTGEMPDGVLIVVDERRSEFVSSPRAAVMAPIGLAAMDVPANVVVLRGLPGGAASADVRLGYLLADPSVIECIAGHADDADPLASAELARLLAPGEFARIEDRVEWIRAERQRIERTLRDRMERAEIEGRPFIDIVHSDGDFVWLPVGVRALALHDHLVEATGVATRVYAGEGVQYVVGEEGCNDAFIDAVAEWATR